MCGFNNGSCGLIWILLLLDCFGGCGTSAASSTGCGCGCGGSTWGGDNNNWWWIILLLLFSGCSGTSVASGGCGAAAIAAALAAARLLKSTSYKIPGRSRGFHDKPSVWRRRSFGDAASFYQNEPLESEIACITNAITSSGVGISSLQGIVLQSS